MESKKRNRAVSVVLLVAITTFSLSAYYQTGITSANNSHRRFKATPLQMGFVYNEVNGEATCRQATVEEAREMAEHSSNVRLKPISPIRPNQTGLKIILRGTPQLDSFPQAKQAFLKAAATWERLILTPITVIIDVDFGQNRFGDPFPFNVLGSTLNQFKITEPAEYQSVRQSLINSASNSTEGNLYNALPITGFQTDIGTTTQIVSPTSTLRALNLLPAVPDPDGEMQVLGPPPAISFNSRFFYDFDPTDGIDSNKFDFDTIATHEIGHVLGFFSLTGYYEIFNNIPLSVSILDIFRFRPGTATLTSFGTTNRILSSGGDQIFFAGGDEIQLSTGRPDTLSGDGKQASHWKDSSFVGRVIGIMDPSIGQGERVVISDNDLAAFDSLGYSVLISTPDPDYSLLFSPNQVTASRGQSGRFLLAINRTGGFAGNVTVTAPDTKSIKVKITQPSQSTTGGSLGFDFKVKKKAAVGTQQLTFTGRDETGRVRTANLSLVIR